MAVTVRELVGDKTKPACICEDATAAAALRVMIENDFSQLPVVNGEEEFVGMITTDSIARALNLLDLKIESLRVSNALVSTKQYKLESDITEILEGLRDAYAVPVLDNSARVIGIITNYDTAAYFRSRAEDMMLVEDVETMLKDCIRVDMIAQQGQLEDTELSAKISDQLGIKFIDEMTISDFILLFLHGDRWTRYSSKVDLDRDTCRKMLKVVNDIRNDLFHFRTDISEDRRYGLKYCRDWLNKHQQVIMEALRPAGESIAKVATLDEIADEKGVSTEELTSKVEELAESPQVIEETTSGRSKYEGIATFLQTLPSHIQDVALGFDEFESIIESELPRSALEHRSWWANDSSSHIQSRQWLEVGWRASNVNMSQQRVTFTRIKDREQKYIVFFSELLTKIRTRGQDLKNVSPSGRSFVQLNEIRSVTDERIAFVGCSFARQSRFRVEFYIDSLDHFKNSFIFENLKKYKDEIDAAITWNLEWETLEERRAVRIAAYHPGSITDSRDTLERLSDWAVEYVIQFDRLFLHQFEDRIMEIEAVAESTTA